MVEVDPLYILLLLEAVVLLAVAVAYMVYRGRRAAGGPRAVEMEDLIRAMETELLALKGEVEGRSAEDPDDLEALLQRRIYELDYGFMTALYDALRKGGEGAEALTRSIRAGFRESAGKGLVWVKDVIGMKERVVSEAVEEAEEKGKALRRFQEAFKRQRRKMAELLGAQEMLEQVRKRFDRLRERNRELRDRLKGLKDPGDVEELQRCLEEMENVNREMALCVETLEKENARLLARLGEYEEGMGEMERDLLVGVGTVPPDAAGLQERVRELEEALREKDRELQGLRRELESLEKEYMVLYKQVNAGG